MMKLTAYNIVKAIDQLPKDRLFDYINKSTTTKVKIDSVEYPDGPIWATRYSDKKSTKVSIPSNLIWRVANAVIPGRPINIDRALAGSYNVRSLFEALLANTPDFYFSYPGRIEVINESSKTKKGHKHLIWLPESPHEKGVIEQIDTDIVISEQVLDVHYESLDVTNSIIDPDLDIDIARRHAQIQVALLKIGEHLGYKTWIAKNDQAIEYNNKKLIEYEGVVNDLTRVSQISNYDKAMKAAAYIDCIWFENHSLMPAVMEIEHSTGVTSGLTRMKGLQEEIPGQLTRYVIVASDDQREKVKKEANRKQFLDLDTRFFPYSAVEELWYLCSKRKISGITDTFLDSFIEPVVSN